MRYTEIIIAFLMLLVSLFSPFLYGWINKVGIDAAVRKTRKIIVTLVIISLALAVVPVTLYRLIPYFKIPNQSLNFIDFVYFSVIMFSISSLMLFYVTRKIMLTIKTRPCFDAENNNCASGSAFNESTKGLKGEHKKIAVRRKS